MIGFATFDTFASDARRDAAALSYAVSILGLEERRSLDHVPLLRSDARDHTLVYCDADPADPHLVSLDDDARSTPRRRRARPTGYRASWFQRRVRARRVGRFVYFKDPTATASTSSSMAGRATTRTRSRRAMRESRVSRTYGLRTTDAVRDEAFWRRYATHASPTASTCAALTD